MGFRPKSPTGLRGWGASPAHLSASAAPGSLQPLCLQSVAGRAGPARAAGSPTCRRPGTLPAGLWPKSLGRGTGRQTRIGSQPRGQQLTVKVSLLLGVPWALQVLLTCWPTARPAPGARVGAFRPHPRPQSPPALPLKAKPGPCVSTAGALPCPGGTCSIRGPCTRDCGCRGVRVRRSGAGGPPAPRARPTAEFGQWSPVLSRVGARGPSAAREAQVTQSRNAGRRTPRVKAEGAGPCPRPPAPCRRPCSLLAELRRGWSPPSKRLTAQGPYFFQLCTRGYVC